MDTTWYIAKPTVVSATMAVLVDSGECNSHRGLTPSAKGKASASKRKAARYANLAQLTAHLNGNEEVKSLILLVGTTIILGFSEQILRQSRRNNV